MKNNQTESERHEKITLSDLMVAYRDYVNGLIKKMLRRFWWLTPIVHFAFEVIRWFF